MSSIYSPRSIDLFEIGSKLNDKTYYIALMNYFRSRVGTDNKEIKHIEDLLYGVIDNKDYKWILNPYNATEERFKSFPGQLKNMDIIMPIIRRFIGEYLKSNNAFHIVSKTPDEDNTFLDELMQFAIDIANKKAQAIVTNELNKQQDNAQAPDPNANLSLADATSDFKLRWKDERAIIDEGLLEFIKYATNDEYLYLKAYAYWIIFGRYYIDRFIQDDDFTKEALHPGEVYPIYTSSDFVDSYEHTLIRKHFTISQVLAMFRNKLKPEDIKYLKAAQNEYIKGGNTTISVQLLLDYMQRDLGPNANIKLDEGHRTLFNKGGLLTVDKLYFTGFKQIKILHYIDIQGEEQYMEVDNKYELQPEYGDLDVETEYLPTTYVMYAIGGKYSGIYIPPVELEVQRNDINNIANKRLPITGKINLMPYFPNHSIPLTLEYYQKTINMLYLARERAIAKNHGKIAILPKGLFGTDDVSEEEQLYRLTASGILFPDETSANFNVAVQALKGIDLADYEYIMALSKLILEVKELANEAVDMNRQRAGETYASDGKFTTQQAIIRSSLGSAMINDVFNNSRCRDYEADIDFSKVAWTKGERGKYITSDRQERFFEINLTRHRETQYGLFADSSMKNSEKISKLQEIAFNASQNGQTITAVDAIDNENISKLKEVLIKHQNHLEALEKQKQEAATVQSQNIAAGTEKAAQIKAATDEKLLAMKLRNDLLIKQMDLQMALNNKANDTDTESDSIIKDLESTIANLQTQLKLKNENAI